MDKNKTIDNLYGLFNNPFILTPLVVEFYKNLTPQPKDILLAYLILPFVLYHESRDDLQRADVRRTLIIFKRENNRIYGLQDRLIEYKSLTNLCIQNAIDTGLIEINENLSVVVKKENSCDPSLQLSFNASTNLAKMLSKHEIVTIYRLTGIKRI